MLDVLTEVLRYPDLDPPLAVKPHHRTDRLEVAI